jgi:hypothetical protein
MRGVIDRAGLERAARPRRVTPPTVLLVVAGLVTVAAGAGGYEDLPWWALVPFGPAELVLAWAVWRARAWAWWSLVALQGSNGAVRLLLAMHGGDTTWDSLDLLVPAAYLLLLASRRTQAWFGVSFAHR